VDREERVRRLRAIAGAFRSDGGNVSEEHDQHLVEAYLATHRSSGA
jgi:hypothetical protein